MRFGKRGMLYIVGLGLGDEKDITLRGLEAVKKCDQIFIEAYTSLLSFGLSSDGLSTLENLYGKPVTLADRETVEEKADQILIAAAASDVAFLVVGDPFGATTHTDLVVRAKKLGIDVKVVHNASVMNAVGICGLQLYHYGETVSIPFFTETWRPDSFYEKIQKNRGLGLHTLCLYTSEGTYSGIIVQVCVQMIDCLLIDFRLEGFTVGRKQYEPPRYMSINTAIEQLLEVEDNRGESAYDENTMCVGLARLGSEDQKIVSGTMKELQSVDFGAPLHCLVIVGKTHPVEEEMLDFYRLKKQNVEENDHGTRQKRRLFLIGVKESSEDKWLRMPFAISSFSSSQSIFPLK
ncbi:Corrin/Porphyrin Tetrapyrrole Methylase [Prunus dulcis]|uniref:diphthine methyl ester synthase n=1 Tax=Prunus dulcis TaxID=3755 RepID=A0A4Y1QSL7_PRUDU|nr:Corrin/Porphyrin Tetrapyrrole Methylase [Prunus dulcis]